MNKQAALSGQHSARSRPFYRKGREGRPLIKTESFETMRFEIKKLKNKAEKTQKRNLKTMICVY